MKKTALLSLFFALWLSTLCGQNVNPDAIVGSWMSGNEKAIIKIYKEGAVYNGKIVWLRVPLNEEGKPKVDHSNPDLSKRQNPIIGLNMLKDFVFKTDSWEDGTIYDPENGKTYSCRIRYRDGKLDLRGYVGIPLFGRTDTWYKAEAKNKE